MSRFISEAMSWKSLIIVDLSVDEELAVAELVMRKKLDFDDELQYYFAKKKQVCIVSFDRDFNKQILKA